MASHADWAAQADDLTDNLLFAAQQWNLGRVSDATGLSQRTIMDSLTRREITHPDNPRGALCRPKYRVGDAPYWDPEQVQEYRRRVEQRSRPSDAHGDLPTLTRDEADEQGLVTNREIWERLGVHDQTIRRHQRSDDQYPRAVAKLSRAGTPGVPELLREWRGILTWAESQPGIQIPDEWAA